MFNLSAASLEYVKKQLARFEARESAIIPCLYRLQQDNGGWVSVEIIAALAQAMDIPEAKINEVFNFYTMFNKRPVGRHHVQVCCNISCSMNGGRELIASLCKHLRAGED